MLYKSYYDIISYNTILAVSLLFIYNTNLSPYKKLKIILNI